MMAHSADGKWIDGLTPTTPVAEAARRVLATRLDVVRHYLGLALRASAEDPEYVHQLRVGTRRAAAALEIFAGCFPAPARDTFAQQLNALRRAAGQARDWDVFLINLPPAAKAQPRLRPGLDCLAGYAHGQRLRAEKRLPSAFPAGPEAFGLWVESVLAAVQPPADGSATLRDLAVPMLTNLVSQLIQAADGDRTDFDQLHQVRIIGKQLRYAMEVFACCFAPPFREQLYAEVEAMQEILGRLNDSYVAIGRLRELTQQLRRDPRGWRRWRPAMVGLIRHHRRCLLQERRRFEVWWAGWQRADAAAAFLALLEPEPA
ncbi:MAG: CHAD domain-containing protein [Gemmataceae bacterium]|nr:CHAD domain-containing protein [Gemmataceae bacterium]MDW8264441.1 CHAD domain-containing protein [Gemmataceae bacterium]